MTKKTASNNGVPAAVEAYLTETPLNGAHKPLAAVARILAESLEAAPPYARARLAKELRDLLAEIDSKSAWDFEIAERREKRMRQGTWASNGET